MESRRRLSGARSRNRSGPREQTYLRRDFSPAALSRCKLAVSFTGELLIEDGGKICGGGEPSRLPAALNSTLSSRSTLPHYQDREKIYGHANYPLKLRETSSRPLRRPQDPRQCAAIAPNFQHSAHKTCRETTAQRSATRSLSLSLSLSPPLALDYRIS